MFITFTSGEREVSRGRSGTVDEFSRFAVVATDVQRYTGA